MRTMTNRQMVSSFVILCALGFGIQACTETGEPLGATYAKGGKPGKPSALKSIELDSIRIDPQETTLTACPSGENCDSVLLLVSYWSDGVPYLKRFEDGQLYIADLVNGCLIDRPKPVADTLGVELTVINTGTGDTTEVVTYAGVRDLPICAR
jgi:hypothetical protein